MGVDVIGALKLKELGVNPSNGEDPAILIDQPLENYKISFQVKHSGTTKFGIRRSDHCSEGVGIILGTYHLWVDATGDLRINSGAPSSDTDGVVVGTQS
jgi:hypothetical protein